ncbi:MAG: flagellar hook-basal body complex protein FliE [Pseudomonadota bacterium]
MNAISSVSSMNINQVLEQIRTNSRNLLGGDVPTTTKADFGSLLESSISKVNSMQNEANTLKTGYELGEPDIDLPTVMISMQKASLAFEGITEVRNKFLNAYQEIMNMPV